MCILSQIFLINFSHYFIKRLDTLKSDKMFIWMLRQYIIYFVVCLSIVYTVFIVEEYPGDIQDVLVKLDQSKPKQLLNF